MKLTAKTVTGLDLDGKDDVIHFDAELPGFGLRLRRAAGGKVLRSWVCQYKRAGGTRRITLGRVGVLGAEQARAAARKLLAKVALGEDPQADRADRRGKDRLTMRAVVDEFLAAREPELAPRTFVEIRRYLTDARYFGPLHGLPVDTVARKDVAARIVAITRASGAPTASRARDALSALFVWAMRMGLTEANPVIGTVKPTQGGGRERVLTDNELAAIWHASRDDDHGRIIRLLILTGCRRAEIGDMSWPEVDLERGTFTIAAARSKNRRAHTLPLPPVALDIIESVPRMVARPQLFGQRARGFTRWSIDKAELDRRSGVIGWTVHDLRRTVATRMADLGVAPHVIEAALNHQSGHKRGVAGIYNRSSYEREVKNALAQWEDHVRVIVEGGERKVVAFPAAVVVT
jgi:integrase